MEYNEKKFNLDDIYFCYVLKNGRASGYRIKNSYDYSYQISVCSFDNKTKKTFNINNLKTLLSINKVVKFENVEDTIKNIKTYLMIRNEADEYFNEKTKKV